MRRFCNIVFRAAICFGISVFVRSLLACVPAVAVAHKRTQNNSTSKLTYPTCPKKASRSLTGWIEKIDENCVLLYTKQDKFIEISKQSFHWKIREGDFVHKGKPSRKRRKKLEKEIQQLLHGPSKK